MTRDLINTLTFTYSLICRGRHVFDKKQIMCLNEASKLMTRKTPEVMEDTGKALTIDEKISINEAQMITDHIDEVSQFLMNLDIC